MTIETSASIENLAAALGKFQAETHGVVRDAVNPFHKNRYATLEAVIETARPGLTKAGLAFLQAPRGAVMSTAVELETMLMHGSSGEWIRFSTIVPLPKPDPQGVGSAITYACRYALMAMLGLPPMDDDAEATKPQPKPPVPQPKLQQIPPDLGYDPRRSATGESFGGALQEMAKQTSKDVYIKNTLKLIREIDSAPKLLARMKDERQKTWPQYGIDGHDVDGQKMVQAYNERMAVLETGAEVSE